MEDDPELQRALLASLGCPTGAAAGGAETAEEEEGGEEVAALQEAIQLSMQGSQLPTESSGGGASTATGLAGALARAPREARELLRTVIRNLQRGLEPSCDPAQAAKYRQLNDAVVRRKLQAAANPEGAYVAATGCLSGLGFGMQGAAERWTLPAEMTPSAALLAELEKAAETPGPAMDAAVVASPSQPSTARACVPGPRSVADFDRLELGALSGLPALQLLVYPRSQVQLVSPDDCLSWAASTGSGRSHWGFYGRRGEDDRVTLTLGCFFGAGDVGVAAHWYSSGGQERTMPSLLARAGGWQWCQTHSNQTFVLRAYPQQQVALCGFKITARPYETEGHLLAMVVPSNAGVEQVLQWSARVVASLPEDQREQTPQTQGGAPAPPPPGGRNMRGPWG